MEYLEEKIEKCFDELQKLYDKRKIIQREIFDNISKNSHDTEVNNRKAAVEIFNQCVMSQMDIDVDPDPFSYYQNYLGPYTENFPEEEDFRLALRPIREHIALVYETNESLVDIEKDKKLMLQRAKDFGLTLDGLRRVSMVYSDEVRDLKLQKLIVLCQKIDELKKDLDNSVMLSDIILTKNITDAIEEKNHEVKRILNSEVFGKATLRNMLTMFEISRETSEKILTFNEKTENEIVR